MFDPDLMAQLSREEQLEFKAGVTIVAKSRMIDLQLARLLSRLQAGAEDESDEELAVKIRTYRIETRRVLTLRELGRSLEGTN